MTEVAQIPTLEEMMNLSGDQGQSQSQSQSQTPEPKKRGRPRKEQTLDQAPRTGTSAGSSAKIERELSNVKKTLDAMFMSAGMMLSAVEPFDGMVISGNGPQVVDALVDTARTNARLREALVNFCTATGYAQIVTAAMGIVLPIAAHHGYAPRPLVMMAPENAVDLHMQQETEKLKRNGTKNGVYQ